jgi:polyferredoxin
MSAPDATLALLIVLAGAMAVITAGLVKWAAEARRVTSAAVVLFLFAMMTAMLGGALVDLLHPGTTGLVDGLWLASAAMSLSVFPVFRTFLLDARSRIQSGEQYRPAEVRRRGLFGVAILGLVVLNELLMGWVFQLGAGSLAPGAARSVADVLVLGVNSAWFLFPMALEMGLTAYLLRAVLPRPFVALLLAQAVVMFLSAPAFPGSTSLALVLGLSSAGMIAIIVFLMEFLYQHRQLAPVLSGYFLGLMAIYAVMMSGLYTWLVYGDGLLFAASVLLEMALFFDAVVRPERFAEDPGTPWQLRPHWTFGVLAAIFVGELFMGAVLDLAFEPSVYGTAFPALALSGGAGATAYSALYNGFWFVAAVTGSTWFLAMMGVEMGALVAFKFRETRSRENKIRMGLLMGSYAIFATFFPSFYYAALFPHAPVGSAVPVLGWSMGLGSAPIVPSLLLVIFLSYAVTGALTVLFGRRVVCSVFCTAPLMYQGTTFTAMNSFNRSSPVAHKYLGSRFSTLFSATTGVTMASLVAVSFLSFFDQTGRLSVSLLGADPSVFFFSLSFGVLWFLLFVTIPYTGNYNCVTMGWCYTGTIAAAFSRLGFFKLKVRDRAVCQRCTTLDCAKKCPVGLVDMPGHFRQFGEFRSSKCCGVGSCVDACPYGNLYIHDVRHWVAQRLRRRHEPPVGRRLPMVSATPRRAPVAAAGSALASEGASGALSH